MSKEPAWAPFWGKTSDRGNPPEHYHLLAYHNLDVAAVAWQFLTVDGATCERLARGLGWEPGVVRQVVTFWLMWHDLGKFHMSFQQLSRALGERLHGKPPGVQPAGYAVRHDAMGFAVWNKVLSKAEEPWFKMPPDPYQWQDMFRVFDRGVWGHHGRPYRFGALESVEFLPRTQAAILAYAAEAKALLHAPHELVSWPCSEEHIDRLERLSWALAGLYVLCDWVGSDAQDFPYIARSMPLAKYWEEHALPQAKRALERKHLRPCRPSGRREFEALFPTLGAFKPRPLQQVALELEISDEPQLFIVEAQTGSGKTEAALLLARALMQKGAGQGVFLGLPTMATSNAMFERLAGSYRQLFEPGQLPSLVLSHGKRGLSEAFDAVLKAGEVLEQAHVGAGVDKAYGIDRTLSPGEAVCAAWFAQRKNLAFFADVGVGTIDQAMIAALTIHHQSLRLFGLGRRVLIIDEVHAYDAYMNSVIGELLAHHGAQGGSAILLSATLDQGTRARLVAAFCRGIKEGCTVAVESQAYPLLTHVTPQGAREHAVARDASMSREIEVAFWHDPDLEMLGDQIEEMVKHQDGCFCWIRNTVDDAIRGARALEARLGRAHVTLFHARMTMSERQDVEQQILRQFGKDGDPSGRAGHVVVATQVIEQSLDLDFDFMLSDLAPIDQLLQRFGRWRRHKRDAQGVLLPPSEPDGRPAHPVCILAPGWQEAEQVQEGWFRGFLPSSSYVYPNHGQLWLTQKLLGGSSEVPSTIAIPQDLRGLIEGVYSPQACWEMPEALDVHKISAQSVDRAARSQAGLNVLPLDGFYGGDLDKDVQWAGDTVVPTRLGEVTTTCRLVRYDRQRDVAAPWGKGRQGWAMGELSVRAAKVSQGSVGFDEAHLQKIRALMPDRGRYVQLLLMEQDGTQGQRWHTDVINGQEDVVRIFYDTRYGLLFEPLSD